MGLLINSKLTSWNVMLIKLSYHAASCGVWLTDLPVSTNDQVAQFFLLEIQAIFQHSLGIHSRHLFIPFLCSSLHTFINWWDTKRFSDLSVFHSTYILTSTFFNISILLFPTFMSILLRSRL